MSDITPAQAWNTNQANNASAANIAGMNNAANLAQAGISSYTTLAAASISANSAIIRESMGLVAERERLGHQLMANAALAEMSQRASSASEGRAIEMQREQLAIQIWQFSAELAQRQAEFAATHALNAAQLQATLDIAESELNQQREQFAAQHGLSVEQFNLDKAMAEAQQFANPADWIAQSYYLRNQPAPQGGPLQTGRVEVPYTGTPTNLQSTLGSGGAGFSAPNIPAPPTFGQWQPPAPASGGGNLYGQMGAGLLGNQSQLNVSPEGLRPTWNGGGSLAVAGGGNFYIPNMLGYVTGQNTPATHGGPYPGAAGGGRIVPGAADGGRMAATADAAAEDKNGNGIPDFMETAPDTGVPGPGQTQSPPTQSATQALATPPPPPGSRPLTADGLMVQVDNPDGSATQYGFNSQTNMWEPAGVFNDPLLRPQMRQPELLTGGQGGLWGQPGTHGTTTTTDPLSGSQFTRNRPGDPFYQTQAGAAPGTAPQGLAEWMAWAYSTGDPQLRQQALQMSHQGLTTGDPMAGIPIGSGPLPSLAGPPAPPAPTMPTPAPGGLALASNSPEAQPGPRIENNLGSAIGEPGQPTRFEPSGQSPLPTPDPFALPPNTTVDEQSIIRGPQGQPVGRRSTLDPLPQPPQGDQTTPEGLLASVAANVGVPPPPPPMTWAQRQRQQRMVPGAAGGGISDGMGGGGGQYPSLTANQPLVVGEKGPEVINGLPPGATITPMNGKVGGPTPLYNVTPVNSPAQNVLGGSQTMPASEVVRRPAGGWPFGPGPMTAQPQTAPGPRIADPAPPYGVSAQFPPWLRKMVPGAAGGGVMSPEYGAAMRAGQEGSAAAGGGFAGVSGGGGTQGAVTGGPSSFGPQSGASQQTTQFAPPPPPQAPLGPDPNAGLIAALAGLSSVFGGSTSQMANPASSQSGQQAEAMNLPASVTNALGGAKGPETAPGAGVGPGPLVLNPDGTVSHAPNPNAPVNPNVPTDPTQFPPAAGPAGLGYSAEAASQMPWVQALQGNRQLPLFNAYGGPLNVGGMPGGGNMQGYPDVPAPHQIPLQQWLRMSPTEQQMGAGYYRALGFTPDDLAAMMARQAPGLVQGAAQSRWRAA